MSCTLQVSLSDLLSKVTEEGRLEGVTEFKLNTHMNLLNPDCVKGRRSERRGQSGDEGQDDGWPWASQRGPGPSSAWPTPSAAPPRLHHDSQWCWAGGARWLEETQEQTDRWRLHKPRALACPGPSTTHGALVQGGPQPPRPICPGKGRQGGEARGPGRQGAGHQGPEWTRTRNS